MWRTLTGSVLLAFFLITLTKAQPDPQTALWLVLKKKLGGPEGEQYFNANVKDAAMPALKGILVSALINEGVSRVILKMPESSEPDVTLVVHNGSAKLKATPAAGSIIEFEGVAVAFSAIPFMLTFDVDIGKLRGMEFVRPASKAVLGTSSPVYQLWMVAVPVGRRGLWTSCVGPLLPTVIATNST